MLEVNKYNLNQQLTEIDYSINSEVSPHKLKKRTHNFIKKKIYGLCLGLLRQKLWEKVKMKTLQIIIKNI